MKLSDIIWGLILLPFILILIFDDSRSIFEQLTGDHPYLMGFIKTAILATMGEVLAYRIITSKYKGINGIVYKFIIWGLFGMSFVLVFNIFASGVINSQDKGLLPTSNNILQAFLISLLMNLVFAPTFMALHRITDTFIDLGEGKLSKIIKVDLNNVIEKINWKSFNSFVVLKTIPLFWIPVHTITFLLPPEYRVLMASGLSICLGVILSFAKKSGKISK